MTGESFNLALGLGKAAVTVVPPLLVALNANSNAEIAPANSTEISTPPPVISFKSVSYTHLTLPTKRIV